jgi:ketosteroid isomerase-like protein
VGDDREVADVRLIGDDSEFRLGGRADLEMATRGRGPALGFVARLGTQREGEQMAGEQNVESAKRAYAAFSAGDAAGAMENIADDIEWITPGNSALSGTYRGKQEVGQFWARLAEKAFSTNPQYWLSDEERVVVLTQVSVAGETADQVDVLTFRDGKVVKFQGAGDTAMMERIYGSK